MLGLRIHWGIRSQPKTVYVVSDRELDDYTIHNAITELQKRGFRVIDSRDKAPTSTANTLVLHYLDRWNFDLLWLPVIYLSALNIGIINGNSSQILATARFNDATNTFQSSQKVVANLFAEMDSQRPQVTASKLTRSRKRCPKTG